jgi:hypothetical protein
MLAKFCQNELGEAVLCNPIHCPQTEAVRTDEESDAT